MKNEKTPRRGERVGGKRIQGIAIEEVNLAAKIANSV